MKLLLIINMLMLFDKCNSMIPSLNCDVNVNLTLGSICGTSMNTSLTDGQLFLGVPFALPPVRDLRFAKAVPQTSWNGTLNCTEYKSACAQSNMLGSSEDCLYLNIFSSSNCTLNSTCAVNVFIHGGYFNSRSPVEFDNIEAMLDNFAGRGVILVTVAYRVASFGFFSSNTTEALGNWGMYDMIEALRFVKREIVNFGGDDGNITLHGSGSGAEAVSLLSMTNATKGLFNRTIQIGGTAFNEFWVLQDNNTASLMLSENLGCTNSTTWNSPTVNMTAILLCMRNLSTQQILDSQNTLNSTGVQFTGPRVDGIDGLFPGNITTLSSNRTAYQLLIGTSLFEHAPQIRIRYPSATIADIAEVCDKVVGNSSNSSAIITAACVSYYSTLGIPTATLTDQLTVLINDVTAFVPTYKDATSMRNAGGPVFLHSIDYTKPGLNGVFPSNGVDVAWLMGKDLWTPITPQDQAVEDMYIELMMNFTKYGHPTPDPPSILNYWMPVLFAGASNYYSINGTCTNKLSYHPRATFFWGTGAKIIDKIVSKPAKKSKSPKKSKTTKSKRVSKEKIEADALEMLNTYMDTGEDNDVQVMQQSPEAALITQYLSLMALDSNKPLLMAATIPTLQLKSRLNQNHTMIWITIGLIGTVCSVMLAVVIYRRTKKREIVEDTEKSRLLS